MKTVISKSHNVVLRKKETKSGYSLYLDIHYKGNRYKEYLKLYLINNPSQDRETLKIAEQIKSKRFLELRNKVNNIAKFDKNSNFIEYCEVSNNNGKYALKAFSDYVNGYIAIKDITELFMEKYKSYLLQNFKRNTVCIFVLYFNKFIKDAVKNDILERNILNNISNIKKEKTNKVFLELPEIKMLNDTMPDKMFAKAFLFCCFTGLRFSDVKNLEWSNIVNGSIIIKQKKTQTIVSIPISEQAKLYMPERTDKQRVFYEITRQHYHPDLTAWAKKAKLNKHISFHTSRHTFATLALTYGVDIYTVSKLLGHADISTTQVYAKLVDEKLNQAIDKLPML